MSIVETSFKDRTVCFLVLILGGACTDTVSS